MNRLAAYSTLTLRGACLRIFWFGLRHAWFAAAWVAVQASILSNAVLLPRGHRWSARQIEAASWAVAFTTAFTWAGYPGLFWRLVFAPRPFPWPLTLLGLALGMVAAWQVHLWFVAATWASRRGSTFLGSWRRQPYPVATPYGITELERLKHLTIQGATGSGKTTLLENLIVSDIRDGAGLCVIDPKDSLVRNVLGHVPADREQDVLLLDPSDPNLCLAFNPLDQVPPGRRSVAAAEFVAVLRRSFNQAWGPRMEHILTNCVLALLEVPGSTLLDIPALLTNEDYRHRLLAKVSNVGVQDFFQVEFDQFLRRRGDALEPILNKIGPWASYPELRAVVGQPHSDFNFREVMDQGKVLLVRIPQGLLGEDVSSLLGALVVAKLQMAAHTRADIPSAQRRPFYLYVDEFQNFATSSFARIVTEARGFGLGLICANQYPEQLSPDLQLALAYNAGTMVQCSYINGRYGLSVLRQQDRELKLDPIHVTPPPPVRQSPHRGIEGFTARYQSHSRQDRASNYRSKATFSGQQRTEANSRNPRDTDEQ